MSTVDDENATEFVCFEFDDDDMVEMLSVGLKILYTGLCDTMSLVTLLLMLHCSDGDGLNQC